jgi:NADH-quinone oxidoreductase subunit C
MPSISAENLRERLERDLPGVIAPPPTPTTEPEPAADPPAKGKHAAKKPDFLTTEDTVIVAERLLDVAVYMRDTLGYAYLSDIAVIDYLDDGLLELVYRFYHPEGGGSLVLKVRVPRDNPHVPALTPIWEGANFHEREGYDLFGVIFDGHPNLQRIYMWEEFEGHPMRKDFPKQGDKYLPE